MRLIIELPDELARSNLPVAPSVDIATPAHYAGTDAQSAGAAPNVSGGIALGLTPDYDAMSAGPADGLAVVGATHGAGGVVIDGGAADKSALGYRLQPSKA